MQAMRDWGRVFVATRLEKQVYSKFFLVWMKLQQHGLRPGDAAFVVRGLVAHKALNKIVRAFLESDCDTLFSLDSDADIGPEFLETFRTFEPGQEYDILQAFYARRGWPPEAIWLKKDALGNLSKCHVFEGPNGEPVTSNVDVAGTHACLIRREVFETLLGDNDPDTFEWFYYERGSEASEDAVFSRDAIEAGFEIGATTAVKAGHIHDITTGWQAYQEYIYANGIPQALDKRSRLAALVSEFTGQHVDDVIALSKNGTAHTRHAWHKADPRSAEDVRAFYGLKDNGYFYDLLAWNCSPVYERIVSDLRDEAGQRALVVGGGLGSEAATLLEKGNRVDVFELPGILREFLRFRFDGHVNLFEQGTLPQALADNAKPYDLAVLIDVVEHIHPDEFDETMNALAGSVERFYIHNNFGQQDSMPMHYDHTERFAGWLKRHDIRQTGPDTFEREHAKGTIRIQK